MLFTHSFSESIASLEDKYQLLFEKFGAPSIHADTTNALATLAHGNTTSISVSCGEGPTSILYVKEGQATELFHELNIGGRDITRYLSLLLNEATEDPIPLDVVQKIKERCCYALCDTCDVTTKEMFELPDGNTVTMQVDSYRCTEILFQPQLFAKNMKGLHHCLADMVKRSKIGTIVFYGGTSLIPNLKESLEQRMEYIKSDPVSIVTDPRAVILPWIGGTMLTQLSNFEDLCIPKGLYEEQGSIYRLTI